MSILMIQQAQQHADRVAVIDREGEHTYEAILRAAGRVAARLLQGRDDLQEARVTFMVPPGAPYVAVQWGIWLAGGIAVPLCLTHPDAELEYVLEDTGADIAVAHADFAGRLRPLAERHGATFVALEQALTAEPVDLPPVAADRRAMILYTSGTTKKPKGVVLTHKNITAQIRTLIDAWAWRADDRILHVLPLHHTHGIINALCCCLWAGATCEMLPKFDAETVWARFIESPLTLFMAVPTIYYRLIAAWENAEPERKEAMSQACRKFRLMVSGSAALPVSVFRQWQEISGQTLLERYGMTEIGMALSNPLHGERRPGTVGQPLPGVQVRLVNEAGLEIHAEGQPGEIQVRGATVFREYWQRPEDTAEAFRDGWFCTGDMAVIEHGYFRILGRKSVDIIKSGGYKISALEIEEVLRTHPAVAECAVVGIPDEEWGERVAAAVIVKPGQSLQLGELRRWAADKLAPYKIPTRLVCVDDLPRNAMGKVRKPAVEGVV
ncbi:MAG: acyl-CoA synthetase [candidate division KSB1 bacterium]|nr:acyl-CoA synthetase [candidate division KSB1 bacterium]